MAKKTAKQKQTNRNKQQQKRIIKTLARAKQKSKAKPKHSKTSGEFKFADIFMQENLSRNNNEHQQSIKTTFSEILKKYSKIDTTSIFSSLLLNPNYQSSQYRLEKAISICLSFCDGNEKPDLNLIKFIFEKINEFGFEHMEDPAEDVFISTIWFEGKQYKLSTGLWEGGIYQAQIFLDFIEEAPDNDRNIFLKNRLQAILKASDLIITKAGLSVNEVGAKYPIEDINYEELSNLDELTDKVKIQTFNDSTLLPCINANNTSKLYKQEFGASDLEENPFFISGDKYSLILPSSILVCIKRQVVNFIRDNYSDELLNALFFDYQAKRIHNTNLFKKFKHIPIEFFKIKGIDNWGYFESVIEFDKGYFFHFVFLAESLNLLDSAWFNGFSKPSDNLSTHIEKAISKAKTFVIEKQGGRKGCTIIVPCGYGKGLALGLNVKSDNKWMLEIINSHDLETISNDTDCSPHKIWRIIESLEQLISMDVRLLNPNGFLNLYAYAKENNYCLIPHSSFQEPNGNPSNIIFSIPSNCQADLRQKILKNTETLMVHHHKLGAVKVIRGFTGSLFSNNERYDIYCPESVDLPVLQVVYTHSNCEIWIEQKISQDYDFSLQFQCFDAATSWIHKIISVITSDGLLIPESLSVWNLSFNFPEDKNKMRDCPKSEEILSCFSNEFINPILHSKFGTEFIDGLRQEDNFSEQALILSLISYICDFNKIKDYSVILNKVIESIDARHMHLFVANIYREHFISDKQEPIYIEQTDENNIKLNLGWSCWDRNRGNLIEGKLECKKYLKDLVSYVSKIITTKLRNFDRELLIYKLLINTEHSDHQKMRWQRTFKANLALQKDKENLYSVVNNQIGMLNAASLSSRLVIEMAICVCPLNSGKEAGTLDIQELICLASLMHHMGGLSETINYDAIEPKLVISTFGDVMYNHDFDDNTLRSYALKLNRSTLSTSIKEYGIHLSESKPVEAVNNLFENAFNKAFVDEFGFTIDNIRLFIDTLEDYGLKQDELVYKISHENLVDMFDEVRFDITETIIQELVLYPREGWTIIPPPFKPTDWQPWRFRRRFSLIMRPIVRLDESNYLISPQHIRNAFIYLLKSCHSATLDENHFSSKLMRKWIGNTRKTNGLTFNTTVANRLQELGWSVREEIKLTEILNQKLSDYGDVDVLAWNNKLKIVAVIECKDLQFAKTQGEIARQTHDFKGQKNEKKKKDRLLKHVFRLNILNENITQLSKFTKMNSEFTVKGYVVFSNTVPMIFNDSRLFQEEIKFLTFDQLEQL
ncbi:MAG: hypothetical protein methR_P1971 [Methyloprofundus sp.]|nr:MAG: hypothetical protein methR_P1971 [Methyloprofundus sp.]